MMFDDKTKVIILSDEVLNIYRGHICDNFKWRM